ncbi:MAG: hemolysin III family protein, partial [Chloroflexota bacterium]
MSTTGPPRIAPTPPAAQAPGLRRYLLEPVNTLTHLAAAIAALLGTLLLLYLTRQQPAKMASLAIYGLCLILLFAASSLLHGVKLPDERRMWLNRLDHVAIFLLIAGTYTPIVYNLLPAAWNWPLLLTMWTLALLGTAYKLFSPRIHGFLNASVYPILAWAGVVPAILAYRIEPFVPAGGLALLFLGGAIYMVGFAIYYLRRPDPWPDTFGHHEIWHIFVIAASLCHFIF